MLQGSGPGVSSLKEPIQAWQMWREGRREEERTAESVWAMLLLEDQKAIGPLLQASVTGPTRYFSR